MADPNIGNLVMNANAIFVASTHDVVFELPTNYSLIERSM
jgi:hypothetical protein